MNRPILVEGYTDAQGSEDTNQLLSQRRANAVREYLERRGVAAEHLRAVGKGETDPVASNETAEGRANNRRVEIIVSRETAAASSREGEPHSRQSGVNSSGGSSAPGSAAPASTTPAASDSFPAPRTSPAEEPEPRR